MPTWAFIAETEEEIAALEEIQKFWEVSDRSMAIIGGSLVKRRLEASIKMSLRLTDRIEKEMFRSSGPLGSFSAKSISDSWWDCTTSRFGESW